MEITSQKCQKTLPGIKFFQGNRIKYFCVKVKWHQEEACSWRYRQLR